MKIFFFVSIFTITLIAAAEPWISNRFAKNCAGCHAPGRVNVVPEKRRCTLSCQGCHVNPNGGGLRNFYGKWNEDTWLKSFEISSWKKGQPHPKRYDKQPYHHSVVEKYLKKLPKAKQSRFLTKKAKAGIRYVHADKPTTEKDHDRHNGADEHTIVKDDRKAQIRIPQDDPWRLRRTRLITAGADFRYFYYQRTREGSGSQTFTFPMAADIGLRAMPVDKVAFVAEARFLNGPNKSRFDEVYSAGQVRSAYFIVDDLMYNTYVMSGMYRPMFGYYNVDHRSASSQLTGLGHSYVANAVTIGGSPNVPFYQIHFLSPNTNSLVKDSGLVINAGGRFITYGASIMASYWSTKQTSGTQDKKNMSSLTLGFDHFGVTGNFDFVSYTREVPNVSKDSGFYWLADLKYRFWREFYLTTTYVSANTALNFKEGSANDLSFGVKSFLLSGVEFELLMVNRNNLPASGSQTKDSGLQGQLHWYF